MSVLPGCQLSITRQRNDDSRLLKYANEKRLNDWFNDTTVGVGTQRIPANRMVLSCYSGYFEEKFLIKTGYNASVSITDMDEEPVMKLIEFIYTKEIVINHKNVMLLFITAVKLKIESAIQFCLEYLQSAINTDNCFFILNKANIHKVESLKILAYNYMSENINEVSKSDEFKELSKADLSSCISNIDRNKTSETFLYETIIKWTKHKEENRKLDFSDLFLESEILDQLPSDYLLQVVAEENLVKENFACYKAVMEMCKNLLKVSRMNKGESKILSLGGIMTRSKLLEVFNLLQNNPKIYPDIPMNVSGHCSINLDNIIFCIGGSVDRTNNPTNKVLQMDLKQESLEWKEIAEINEKRYLMGAAVYNGVLVVAGGYDGSTALASTEAYTKSRNKWHFFSPMNQTRVCHCLVTCDNCLYAIGGRSSDKRILSSVERLPALHGNWELIKPMQTPRKWFAAVCVKGTIFVIGGLSISDDNYVRLKSVEMFDPDKMTWKYVKDLNIARANHAACVLDNKIYVVGGVDASLNAVHEIECYDPLREEWSIVGKTMEKLCNHSLVVI